MNAKNLPLKFLFLIVLVAVCLLSIHFNGLKQGIDLRGGHSLTFEIRTNEAQSAALKDRQAELREDLANADPDGKAEIQQALERVTQELDRIAATGAEASDLIDRIVSTLKQRVDPRGLYNTEWRPLGANRFEVRMPAARTDSRDAKLAYMRAIEALEATNIRPSEIRRVLQVTGEQRQRQIDLLSDKDPAMIAPLEQLASLYDVMMTARKQGAESAGYLNALAAYEQAMRSLLAKNISPAELQGILGNYVPPVEADSLGKDGTDSRMAVYRDQFDQFVEAHASRAAKIADVRDLYEQWAQKRQYLDDPSDLIRLIAKAGVLEYRIAPLRPGAGEGARISEADLTRYVQELQTKGPEYGRSRNERFLWFPIHGERSGYDGLVTADFAGKRYVLLYNQSGYVMLRQPGKGSWKLDSAYVTTDDKNRPAVGFTFDEAGARLFGQLTADHKGDQMAVLLDEEVYSAPTIQAVISKRGIITGQFTVDEVRDLVRTLEAGSLPARVNPNPVAENTFGPAIGAINRETGIKAAYWGLICVAIFMMVYYMLAGAIANVALVLNIVLILGAMSLLNAVFTLPGIAGVILTIGIAVDANVLIFERLREEQAKGQSVRMALKNAYQRAFSAIFDANLTTLITCLILAWVGTEEIRGFAITLALGVMFSLFTAMVVTRWIFQTLLDGNLVKRPVTMMRILGVPKVNWMSKRYFFWGLSAVFVAMGIASLVWQKSNVLGIEFSAGTQAVIQLKDDALLDGKLPNDQTVAKDFRNMAAGLGYDKLRDTSRVETLINPNRVQDFLASHNLPPASDISLAQWQQAKLPEAYFEQLDRNTDGQVSVEELDEYLPQTSYQVSTTENELERIRQVARDAFGKALQVRTPSSFGLAKAMRSAELGVNLAPNGLTRLTPTMWAKAAPSFRDSLEDYQGGLLMVFGNVEPAMTLADLTQRIREMRLQPDYADQLNPTQVLGLVPVGDEGYSSLAVLVKPSDFEAMRRPGAWNTFAEKELNLVSDAFERSEAMPATNFDAAIAGEAAQLAVVALILSWLAIIAYLWFRFGNWRWGMAAVVCLIHDTVIVVGLVAASGWLHEYLGFLGVQSFKIDLAMVAAVLTVIGYSVNDTIVVFDRIRENRGKLTTVTPMVINASINQTLSRTLLTSGTTLIVLVIMYVWGGAGIHAFAFALLVGVLFGTYSSVAVASPLLMGFRKALVARTAGTAAAK